MVYCLVLHFLQFIFDVLTVGHLSEREKDVQILLLRQQLRIVERKQRHASRLPRWQKLILALLAGWLQRQGKAGQAKLREVSLLFQPQTLLKWHREAVRRKWTFKPKGPVGRPRTAAELETLVVRLARENPEWGYSRLEDELAKLGFDIGETTIRDIFKRHGLPPAPERSRQGSSWRTFLKHYQDQILACDFLTVETLGLQTVYILFFIHVATRRVFIAGCTAHPDAMWVTQQARQLTWVLAENQLSIRFLIHDRDTKFTAAFDTVFQAEGVKIIRTPFRAPNANAYAERWVRTLREECLDRLIVLNQSHLRRILTEYSRYYNERRPHQGLDGATPLPLDVPIIDAPLRRRDILGGIIHDYYRAA